MPDEHPTIAALVGSRICHDLISPIGAINNGLELLAMSGVGNSPEIALISESVDAANARIRFFRIAYGKPSGTQHMKRDEVLSILRDMTRGTRIEVHWEPSEDLPRSDVQVAFLAIQCAEQAAPYGGRIALRRIGQVWEITVTADRFSMDETLWSHLSKEGPDDGNVMPAHVQFLLLPNAVAACGRSLSYSMHSDQTLTLTC